MFSKPTLKRSLVAVLLATLGISGVAVAQPRFDQPVVNRSVYSHPLYGRRVVRIFSPYDLNRDGRLDRFELRRMRRDQLQGGSGPVRYYPAARWHG